MKKARQFDPTKPVQTTDGRKARIICVDRKFTDFEGHKMPILALVETVYRTGDVGFKADEVVLSFQQNGRGTSVHLENVPEKWFVILFWDSSESVGHRLKVTAACPCVGEEAEQLAWRNVARCEHFQPLEIVRFIPPTIPKKTKFKIKKGR